MKKDYTDITLIVDRSGSMASLHKDVVGGLNAFIEEQKKLPGTATISVYQFDDRYETVLENEDVHDVRKFTNEDFVPRGGTALLDAIGRTVNTKGATFASMREEHRPEKVILVIFTDGYENQSREFSRSKVVDMLKHQQEKYSWEVIYLGADQDAIAEGANLGMMQGKSMTWEKTSGGIIGAVKSAATYTSNYRSGKAGW